MAIKTKKEKEQGSAPRSGDFKKHLEEIAAILEWFDSQEELDIEKALDKVKQASALIKESRARLGELENQFEEIKADIEEDK
jgi:exonuclease VII small subunit